MEDNEKLEKIEAGIENISRIVTDLVLRTQALEDILLEKDIITQDDFKKQVEIVKDKLVSIVGEALQQQEDVS